MKRVLSIAVLIIVSMVAVSVYLQASGQVNLFQEFFQKEKETKKLLLPDMAPTEPKQLLIRMQNGSRHLRFSTTFYNKGLGPLEIIGHNNKDTQKTYASQYIYEEGGSGIFKDIGEFIYHSAHSHWHVDKYVYYELWSLKDGQEDKLLITTDKMSFCIFDEVARDLTIDKASKNKVYSPSCFRNTQGMSVGWSDTYRALVEGQDIDLKDIPDGTYVFKTTINPDRKIEEMDYDNNTVNVYIEIKGNTVVRKANP